MKFLLCGAAAALALAAPSAQAAVVEMYVGADLTASPYTLDLGVGTLTFSTVDSSFFARDPTGVATTGAVQVFSVGAPFYSQPTPTSYFLDRGGEFGPGQLGFFASYATPTAIPYSLSEGLVGFGFTLADGLHYGVVDLGGSTLFGFRYETVANVGVALAAVTPLAPGAVPEPATWALMIAGFGMAGAALRRRRPARDMLAVAVA